VQEVEQTLIVYEKVAPKSTATKLAEKHGIDISKVPDQQEEIDILTGKRICEDE
jgi:hypothetical protein